MSIISKCLPSNVSLYYMCFDPAKPELQPGYVARLPKFIVPFKLQGVDRYKKIPQQQERRGLRQFCRC